MRASRTLKAVEICLDRYPLLGSRQLVYSSSRESLFLGFYLSSCFAKENLQVQFFQN